ncbi:hypothetical protein [Acinetobacter pollinis]|uniref:hypothetical protein n=1 Tax=Acinetobacter pollinis TaxID=2605270 RepID=UPI0018A27BA4|nr:hypothetical protein [Acinetobacter pollinis]MBF7691687.1 hypothetical protein [Acinetobacter pollinis]MBF7699318.1 hypothetical protein [Acinetobacter pollinis]
MSKRITSWILSVALFFSSSVYAINFDSIAPENNICQRSNTIFAFFNGVMTSKKLALDNLAKLQVINGNSAPNGDQIEYELMYNYSNGLEDFAETFEQRFKEEVLLKDRWELFFQTLNDQGSWWNNIVNGVPELIIDADNWRKISETKTIKNLLSLISNPPTQKNYQEHRSKIDTWASQGKKLLFVAHSQGNLFANEAYRYATKNNNLSTDSVKVVHIAPASPTTNGPHILADQDLVINGLRLNGTVPSVTHLIPIYKPFGNNAGRDFMGHGLVETYLNPAFSMYSTIKDDITQALNSLKAPNAKGGIGFFTATLTTALGSDIDSISTHVFEPSGNHVFYYTPQGLSGYLYKVFTPYFTGPEVYVASCDRTRLATGIYHISLGNYDGNATNKSATLQIASNADGVLATQTVTLGAAQSRESPTTGNIFNVRVSFNSKTNKYSASIE